MFSTMNNKPTMRSNLSGRGVLEWLNTRLQSSQGAAARRAAKFAALSIPMLAGASSAQAMSTMLFCHNMPDDNRGWHCHRFRCDACDCDNLGELAPFERCFDLSLVAAAPVTGEVTLIGLHPSLNNSGVLGAIGPITILGLADGSNVAYRLNESNPQLIEVAPLPNAPDLEALGGVVTGMQFVGYEIELPPMIIGYEPETVTSGDFAIYFAVVDSATMEVIDTRIEPVETASLQFTLLGPTCAGADTNWDGQINLMDLAVVLANFGNPGTQSEGDLDADGTVGLSDLSSLLTYFGSSCQ